MTIAAAGAALAIGAFAWGAHRRLAIAAATDDAHRYAGRFDIAAPHYERALTLAGQRCPDLLDFALQHSGKHRLDTGDRLGAIACFEEALRLRVVKGDPTLITSSRAALALADGGTGSVDSPRHRRLGIRRRRRRRSQQSEHTHHGGDRHPRSVSSHFSLSTQAPGVPVIDQSSDVDVGRWRNVGRIWTSVLGCHHRWVRYGADGVKCPMGDHRR
jgi:tetratricopeptide (TPR) repeat protein